MNNQVANTGVTKETVSFNMFMSNASVQKKVNQIIGGQQGQQFITSIVASVQNNPALQECSNTSIFTAALLGSSLNLSPSPQLGQYYMVPFKTKNKGIVAQFQLGYKGYQQLAIRSGQLKKLNVTEIKEGELIKYDPVNEEIVINLIEDEEIRDNTPTTGYYAMFELLNGYRKTMYWSIKKMELHADKYSQAFNLKTYRDIQNGKIKQEDMWKYSSFWYKNFDEMAKKTLLRQIISKGGMPMSIEFQTAYESDMAVLNEDGSKEYIDNEQSDAVIPQDEPTEEETVDNDIDVKEPVMTVNLKDLK